MASILLLWLPQNCHSPIGDAIEKRVLMVSQPGLLWTSSILFSLPLRDSLETLESPILSRAFFLFCFFFRHGPTGIKKELKMA